MAKSLICVAFSIRLPAYVCDRVLCIVMCNELLLLRMCVLWANWHNSHILESSSFARTHVCECARERERAQVREGAMRLL